MTDLRTSYLGLDLCSPIVASAGPLTGTRVTAERLGAAGAGAIVMPSLFEEEIVHDAWSSRTRMPWTDIARVTPAFDRRGLILISGRTGARWSHRARTPTVRLGGGARRIWRSDNPAIGGSIALEGDRFAVDEHRLYRFLAFYAGNPSARTELGSPQALDRWNSVL